MKLKIIDTCCIENTNIIVNSLNNGYVFIELINVGLDNIEALKEAGFEVSRNPILEKTSSSEIYNALIIGKFKKDEK